MGKKQLIWLSLLTMLIGVPAIVSADSHVNERHVNERHGIDNGPYGAGWNMGYKTGYDSGLADHDRGAKLDIDEAQGFKAFKSSCESIKGRDEGRCKNGYNQGFRLGYQDGFYGMASRLVSPVETPSAAELTPSMEQTQAPAEMARADEGSRTAEEGTGPFRTGWDSGYKTGYDSGQADHSRGAKLDADDAPGYRAFKSTCESVEGRDEIQCKKGYDKGFMLGYQDGYSGLTSRLVSPAPTPQAAETPAQSAAPIESQPSTAMETPQPSTTIETPAPESSANTSEKQEMAQAAQPKSLPKTASSLPLLALLGLAGIALSFLFRVLRNTIG
jgi:hypothetical protein